MKEVQVVISKKIDGAYVKQGEIQVTVPTVEDMLSALAGAKVTGDEDGLPVYDNDIANYVQSAVFNYVKMGARNKLVSGTVDLKPGAKIPRNWEELCAEGDRGGNGAALALAREVKEAFGKWAATLGKSAAAQAAMVSLFGNRNALTMQTAENKGKMKAYVEQFAASLSEDDLTKYERPLENVIAAATSETVDF